MRVEGDSSGQQGTQLGAVKCNALWNDDRLMRCAWVN